MSTEHISSTVLSYEESQDINAKLNIYKDRVKNSILNGRDNILDFLSFLERNNLEIRIKQVRK